VGEEIAETILQTSAAWMALPQVVGPEVVRHRGGKTFQVGDVGSAGDGIADALPDADEHILIDVQRIEVFSAIVVVRQGKSRLAPQGGPDVAAHLFHQRPRGCHLWRQGNRRRTRCEYGSHHVLVCAALPFDVRERDETSRARTSGQRILMGADCGRWKINRSGALHVHFPAKDLD